jgi:preprotein translocase subunit SecY
MTIAATTYDRRNEPVVRGLVTVGALIVLLVGMQIPLPGLSPDLLLRIASHHLSAARVSVVALGVTPILLARVILELFRLAIPPLTAWTTKPDHAMQWTRAGRGLALVLAGIQAYGVALAFEGFASPGDEMDWGFRIGIVATAVGATAFLVALADWVTRRGLGDGLLILLAAPIVAHVPHDLAYLVELGRMGAIPPSMIFLPIVLVVVAVALLVTASLVRELGTGVFAAANLDFWPPLLASSVLGPLGALAMIVLGASNLPPTPLILIIHVVALVGLIALFAILRERAGAPQPNRGPVTAVEIVVCVGAVIFAYIFGMSSASAGLGIIAVVAAALSCFSPSVRL